MFVKNGKYLRKYWPVHTTTDHLVHDIAFQRRWSSTYFSSKCKSFKR